MSDEKNTPIWKKEISFRRKPDNDAPESEAGSASIWKKEISLGKKDAGADGVSGAIEAAVESEAPVEAAPAVDLELIARYAPLPDPVAPPAAPPPAPVAPAPIDDAASEQSPIEHDWLTKPLEEVSSPPEEPLTLVPDLLPEAPPSPISLVPAVEEPTPIFSVEPAPSVEPVAPVVAARAICS